MLLIGLFCVAGLIIGIMWYIKSDVRQSEQQPVMVQPEVTQVNAAEYFEKIEANIAEMRWSQAEQLLDAFNADPTRARNLDTENHIIELRNKIECGKDNARADRLVADRKLDEAKSIYEDVLVKDPTNAHAKEGIVKIKEEYSKMGVLTMTYDPAENIQVYINDEKRGGVPMELMLEPGTYRIKVVAEGYHDWQKEVVVKAGDAKPINVKLSKVVDEDQDKKPSGSSSKSNSGSSSPLIGSGKKSGSSSSSSSNKKKSSLLPTKR